MNFDDFWKIYPRRIAKADARKAFSKLTQAQRAAIAEALPKHVALWTERGEPEFIPYPATWIRGERWEDELSPAIPAKEKPKLEIVDGKRKCVNCGERVSSYTSVFGGWACTACYETRDKWAQVPGRASNA